MLIVQRRRVGVLWTPANITTALWLDAADAGTITEGSGLVSQWNDKSGNARHVSQSNAALRPAVQAGAQNGLNGIKFDGADDFLATSADFPPITGNPSFSVFTTHRRGAAKSQSLGWGANAVAQGAVVSDASFAFLGNTNFNAAVSPSAGSTYQYGFTKTPGAINTTSNLYLNGANNNGTGHATSTPNISSVPLRVGRLGPITTIFDDGIFFEIVILASTASTDTRQRIEGYLAHKWGLTANLPADHPYKTAAPTA